MNKLTQSMQSFLKDFIADESGLTAVEYAIAGGLVVGGMVGAFLTLGTNATGQINALSCAAAGQTFTATQIDAGTSNGVSGGSQADAGSCYSEG